MPIRTKTRRRLMILGLAAGALVVLAVGGTWLSGLNRERKSQAARADGMAAYEAGDYKTAEERLGRYLRVHDDDVEALYHWAVARLEVPAAGNEHVRQALTNLRKLLDYDPKHREARTRLLELYAQTNLLDEALALADDVLEDDPEDATALGTKALALGRKGRRVEAYRVAAALNGKQPEDLRLHLLTLEILGNMLSEEIREVLPAEEVERIEAGNPGRSESEMPGLVLADRFERLYETARAGPLEHRFGLLLASAYLHEGVGRAQEARPMLEALAARALEDDALLQDRDFAAVFIDILDASFLHDAAVKVLGRAATVLDDPDISDRIAQRLWELGRYDEMVDRLAGVTPETANRRVESVAIKALGLIRLDRVSDAMPYVDAVEAEKGTIPKAWSAYLKGVALDEDAPPFEVVAVCRDNLPKVPHYVHLAYSLADAYERAGELALAANAWEAVLARAPWWAEPRVRQIRDFLNTGQLAAAGERLRLAVRILPDEEELELLKAALDIAAPWTSKEALASEVAAVLKKYEKSRPEEVIPLRISLLGRTDREKALAELDRAIRSDPPLTLRGFLDLASVCRARRLEGILDCLTRAQEVHGWSPQLAYAWARALADDGEAAEGVALFDRARKEAGSGAEAKSWDLSLAAYRDSIGDPEAAAAWERIAERYPGDHAAQTAILGSRAAWTNPGLIAATLGRLERGGGGEGLTYSVAKARSLLAGTPGQEGEAQTKRRAEDAVGLLTTAVRAAPNVLRPRLLLAEAWAKVGDLGRATEQLEEARRLAPGSFGIALDLSRLLFDDDKPDRARQILSEAIPRLKASPEQLQLAAALLLRVGARDLATAAMNRLADSDELEPTVGLARAFALTGESSRAREICRALLEEGGNEGAQELLGAILLNSGEIEEAGNVLEGLPRKEEILALFHRRLGDLDTSIEHYRAAVRAEPGKASNWQGLAALLAAKREFGQAAACITEARRRDGVRPELPNLGNEGRFLDPEKARALPAGLIIAWIEEPKHRAVAVEVMDMLLDRDAEAPLGDATVNRVEGLAGQNSRFLGLQVAAADILAGAGRYREALKISSRAMSSFNAAAPARQHAFLLRDLGRWTEAITALQTLRDRLPGGREEVDVLLFDTLLRAGRAEDLVKLARESYPGLVKEAPDSHADLGESTRRLLVLVARGLVVSGDAEAARNLLSGALGEDEGWRFAYADIASTHLRDADTAVAWLDEVATSIEDLSSGEWIYLGEAWQRVANRYEDPRAGERLCALLEKVTAEVDPAELRWFPLGILYEQCEEEKKAVAAYRKAIELDVDANVAANNLAMILARSEIHRDLPRALALAERAVAAVPSNPQFHDTLAAVHEARGDLGAARRSMEAARQADPANPKWIVRLAEICFALGTEEGEKAAREARQELDDLLSGGLPLSEELKERARALRLR